MASLQEEVRDVCKLADRVIANPSINPNEKFIELPSVSPYTQGIIAETTIGLGIGALITWLISIIIGQKKEIISLQEKRRMLQELFRKQQAVINRQEKELEKNLRQNKQNKQEIENLKNMIKILKEHIRKVDKAA